MANDHTRRDAVSGSGDITADWGPQGLQITDARPRPVWARITGVAGGTNRYSWAQVNESDTTLPDLGSGFGMSGTTTAGQWPAYEVTGNGSVATGTKVQIWPSPAGQFWLFYSPSASGSGTVTSIVTKEVDGAPSYTFTSTISMEFDQGDGFVLSQPAAGRVKFDLAAATASQTGVVSTTTQTFGGDKTFEGVIYAQGDDLSADGFSIIATNGVSTTGIFYGSGVTGVFTYPSAGQAAAAVLNDGLDTGGADWGFLVGADSSYSDTTDRYVRLFGGVANASARKGELEINGGIQFEGMADSAAPNNFLYYSTTASKLVYKDSGGTVNNLY